MLCLPPRAAASEHETWWPAAPATVDWPETVATARMADLLADASRNFYLKFWNVDYTAAQLEKEASLSIMFPPFHKRKCEEYAATVRQRLPELLPHWIWIGPLRGEIRPVVYRLSPDKNYHKVGDVEAERLLVSTTRLHPENSHASYRELAQWIDDKKNMAMINKFYTATGIDITESVLHSTCGLPLDPSDAPQTSNALTTKKPKYVADRSEPLNLFYILQQNGSYVMGSDAVSDILDARLNAPPVCDENNFSPPTEDREEQALLQQAGTGARALLRRGKGVRQESTGQKARKP